MTTTPELSSMVMTISRTEIYEAPTFEEVRAANGENGFASRVLSLKTAQFNATSHEEDPETLNATCELGELRLQNISNIEYSSLEREFSFYGETVSHRDHTSYNQTSIRTERTKYKVVVRWTYNEGTARAYLILIW